MSDVIIYDFVFVRDAVPYWAFEFKSTITF